MCGICKRSETRPEFLILEYVKEVRLYRINGCRTIEIGINNY